MLDTGTMNYTKLSLSEIADGIRRIGEEAHATFGALGDDQLNWKPDEAQWSVAQCFDHLLASDELILESSKSALANPPHSIWQRLPLWPAMFGRLLITSQGPRQPSSRKFVADPKATPPSRVAPGIIQRFTDQHRSLETWTRSLDERRASRAILVSPFASFVTYSVVDGLRLLVAHDRRHFEQAQRVLAARR